MFVGTTAADTASFAIKSRDYEAFFHTEPPAYMEAFHPSYPLLTGMRLATLLNGPTSIAPQWVTTVQNRLFASIDREGQPAESNGRWLTQDVAGAASTFFERTADLLPGEPFIYSSRLGDLVAEFKSEAGAITTIISTEFALLFSSAGGVSVEIKVLEGDDVRDAVRQIMANIPGTTDQRNGVATR